MTEVEARILRNQIAIMETLAMPSLDKLRRAILASEALLTEQTMADVRKERDQPEVEPSTP